MIIYNVCTLGIVTASCRVVELYNVRTPFFCVGFLPRFRESKPRVSLNLRGRSYSLCYMNVCTQTNY
jgi:hypothetical protein